ncbi:MAG TPA: hypothetical protein VJ850_07775 [Candidatus Limnocylindrales bacterium]|nr:hypothetical protein [Candidatus Limnocylindrales bacterium]
MTLAFLLVACNSASLPPSAEVNRDVAIAITLHAFPKYTIDQVISVDHGKVGSFVTPAFADRLAKVLDHQSWRIRLGSQPSPTGGEGTEVIVDATDGNIVLTSDWAS